MLSWPHLFLRADSSASLPSTARYCFWLAGCTDSITAWFSIIPVLHCPSHPILFYHLVLGFFVLLILYIRKTYIGRTCGKSAFIPCLYFLLDWCVCVHSSVQVYVCYVPHSFPSSFPLSYFPSCLCFAYVFAPKGHPLLFLLLLPAVVHA